MASRTENLAFFDSSVLVAAVFRSHPQYEASLLCVAEVINGRRKGAVAAHALLEVYATLTSLPVKPRISPDMARQMLAENIEAHFTVVALSAAETKKLVHEVADRRLAGGVVYDALHCAAARKCKARTLYTWNTAHFLRAWPEGKSVIRTP